MPLLNPAAESTRRIIDATTALGIPAPKPLLEALDVYDALPGIDTYVMPDMAAECMTVTADKVGDLFRRCAKTQQLRDSVPKVRGDLEDLLDRRVLRELQATGARYITALARPFNEAAASFTDAGADLPSDLRSDTIVNAGPTTLAAYSKAKEASMTMDMLAKLRSNLQALGVGHLGGGLVELGTRYTKVTTLVAAEQAGAVRTTGPLSPWSDLLDIDGVIALCWLDLGEQSKLIAQLSSEAEAAAKAKPKPKSRDPWALRAQVLG